MPPRPKFTRHNCDRVSRLFSLGTKHRGPRSQPNEGAGHNQRREAGAEGCGYLYSDYQAHESPFIAPASAATEDAIPSLADWQLSIGGYPLVPKPFRAIWPTPASGRPRIRPSSRSGERFGRTVVCR
jgi:hypothetical protein